MISPAPFSLGLAYQPQHRGVVRQHDYFTFATQPRVGVMAKRILARVLDQIAPTDQVLRPFYQVMVSSLLGRGRRRNAYPEIEEAVRELAGLVCHVQHVERKGWVMRHLLDTTQEQAVGYAKGVVTVMLNPQLAAYFLGLDVCTSYESTSYLRLGTWYAMRLFELLSAIEAPGAWEVSLNEYRRLMDCKPPEVVAKQKNNKSGKYPRVYDLLLHTVTKPLSELAAINVLFDCTLLYGEKQGRGRKQPAGLRFVARSPVRALAS